jgi:hypothetical protein
MNSAQWVELGIFAGCLICLIGCRQTLKRILGLEELRAEQIGKAVRSAGAEPEPPAAKDMANALGERKRRSF